MAPIGFAASATGLSAFVYSGGCSEAGLSMVFAQPLPVLRWFDRRCHNRACGCEGDGKRVKRVKDEQKAIQHAKLAPKEAFV